MTSTLSPTSHYTSPTLHQYKRRVLLKRSTQHINDPEVVQQLKGINNKKKQVKFASDEQLEQVRYFYKSQSPTTAKSDPPMMQYTTEDYKLSLPNWPSRNSIFYNTEQKIRMENVQLINGDYQQMNKNQFVLEGRCRAYNLDFHKVVSVRYTFDLWRSYQELVAEHKESIASTSNTWDRFSFHIPIEAKQKEQSLYLALRYTVGDEEFWDNNNGLNYEVVMTPDAEIIEQEYYDEPINVTAHEEDVEELAMLSNKKDKTKILGRRYDFTASLASAKTYSPPPSPPGTPVDNENFSYTPPVFFGNSNDFIKAEPIPIISKPVVPSAEGFQMSYSDFINKYCFYNSNPIYGSTLSTSPSAVLS